MTGMHVPGVGLTPPVPPDLGGVSMYDDEKNAQLLEARRNLLKAKEDLAGIGGSFEEYGGGGETVRIVKYPLLPAILSFLTPLVSSPFRLTLLVAGIALTGSSLAGGDGVSGISRPPVLRSGGGHISSIMTESQREAKERLARSQRRRVELLGERRKVRNWNVRDSDED